MGSPFVLLKAESPGRRLLPRRTMLWQHRASMLGEPVNRLSLPRAARSTRRAQKQIPMSISNSSHPTNPPRSHGMQGPLMAVLLAASVGSFAAIPANAQQQDPIASLPGTTATAQVSPPPGQPSFHGIIGPTVRESTPYWPAQPRAPKGAPNIVFIMLDDFGFSQLGCYGAAGLRTPNIDKLATNGLRYNNFHATPLCSPTPPPSLPDVTTTRVRWASSPSSRRVSRDTTAECHSRMG